MVIIADVPASEIALRTFAISQLLLLALVMLQAVRQHIVARLGAALCVSTAAFVVSSVPGAENALGGIALLVGGICATHPVWFWLFSTALFADHPRVLQRQAMCVIGMAVAGMVAEPMAPLNATWLGSTYAIVFGLANLVFAALAPLSVFAGAAADLDRTRRSIRRRFVPIVGGYVAAVAVVQALSLMRQVPTPQALVLVNLAVIGGMASLALVSLARLRAGSWLEPLEPTPRVASLSRVESSVLEQLNRRFSAERMYSRESLTIRDLAGALGTQEHVLRAAINRGLGYRNFNDFLHAYRLREVAERLADPKFRRTPILSIALEAGYASIGPFNREFRERFGVTPTIYRHDPRSNGASSPSPLPRIATQEPSQLGQ